jgi:hypothetical protein
MADGKIKATTLTTDEPGHEGQLAIVDGFAFFQNKEGKQLTVRGAGSSSGFNHSTAKTLNFEIFKLEFGAGIQAFAGIAGPAFGVELDLTSESHYSIPAPGEASTGELVFEGTGLRGGLNVGCDVGFYFTIDVDRAFGKKVLSLDLGADFDVLNFLFDLILEKALGSGEKTGHSEMTKPPSGIEQMGVEEGPEGTKPPHRVPGARPTNEFTGFGPVDFNGAPWTTGKGTHSNGPPVGTIQPVWGDSINIVPLTGFLPPPGDCLAVIDKGLKAVWGGLAFGPGIGFGFPVTVKIPEATVGHHRFKVTDAFTANTANEPEVTFTISQETPVDPSLKPLGESVDEVGLLFEHTVGFEISLYFFIEISFLKVCHFGAQTGNINLKTWQNALGGPFQNSLSFVPGGGPVPFGPPTTKPTITGYTANQPQGEWKNGRLAKYSFTYFNDFYETERGPESDVNPDDRFFAFAKLSNITVPPPENPVHPATGRRIYRQFTGDGQEHPVELIGEIANTTATTFTDTHP